MTVTAVPDGARALLAGGGVVRVRMLAPSDVDDVLELHQRVSDRDACSRFFGFARDFLPTVARRITRRSDPKQVALGAYQSDALVGVAHYETFADPHAADAGFTYRTHTDGPESEIVILLDEDDRYLSAVS